MQQIGARDAVSGRTDGRCITGKRDPLGLATGAHLSATHKGSFLSTLIASLALAAIIAGETPGCPFEAKLAVAHVAQRNPVWYGNAEPTTSDILAALTFAQYPDPTDGALFLIGPGDAAKMTYLGKRTARFECNGTWLEAYRGK